jgi:hypothetical protein
MTIAQKLGISREGKDFRARIILSTKRRANCEEEN